MKAVLWVSADGLRVVDDKTKVSKLFSLCVCVASISLFCPPFLSLSFLPTSSLTSGNKDKGLCVLQSCTVYSTQVIYLCLQTPSFYNKGKVKDRQRGRSIEDRNRVNAKQIELFSYIHIPVRHLDLFPPKISNTFSVCPTLMMSRLTAEGPTVHPLS